MIRCRAVSRHYRNGAVPALDGVTLDIATGDCLAITGPSGCGKSTLLNILGGLDRPDDGEVWVGGIALHTADEPTLTHYRRRHMGIVFQFFNLLPSMTVAENVELPLLLRGDAAGPSRRRVAGLLEMLGLGGRTSSFPHQLSGGEMQRAAIARALAHEPCVLLADEPTGNLDSANAATVAGALHTIASQRRTTMVVVTHSSELADSLPTRIAMRDGKILPHP